WGEMQKARSASIDLPREVARVGHHHRHRNARCLPRTRTYLMRGRIHRIVRNDHEAVLWVRLPNDRADVVVKSWVHAADRENHDRGREECTESQSHRAAHMASQAEPLPEGHAVRDEP